MSEKIHSHSQPREDLDIGFGQIPEPPEPKPESLEPEAPQATPGRKLAVTPLEIWRLPAEGHYHIENFHGRE